MLGLADVLNLENLAAVPYGRESALYACAQFIDRLVTNTPSPVLRDLAVQLLGARQTAELKIETLAGAAVSLYSRYLDHFNKRIFVDKTPRYFHIFGLLDKVFPRSKKIFLKRNPLDIAASYKATWGIPVAEMVGDALTACTYDFCFGLFEFKRYFADSSPYKLVIAYEDLVTTPTTTLTKVCDFLAIDFKPEMLNYFRASDMGDIFGTALVGDPRASKAPGELIPSSVGGWKSRFSHEEIARLMGTLGPEIFKALGYEHVVDELETLGITVRDEDAAAARACALTKLRRKYSDARGSEGTSSSFFRGLQAIHQERQQLAAANQALAANIIIAEQSAAKLAAQEMKARDSLAQQSSKLAELELKCAVLNRIVDEHASRLEEKDRHIEELKKSGRTEMNHIVSEYTHQIDIKDQHIQEMNKTTSSLAVRTEILSAKLNSKDAVIAKFANHELDRRAFLAGAVDLSMRLKKNRRRPIYGVFTPAEASGAGRHIVIDALEIVIGVSGGVETYMKMLVSALLANGNQVTIICLPSQVAHLQARFQRKVGYFVMRAAKVMETMSKIADRFSMSRFRMSPSKSLATFSRLSEDLGAEILHSPVQIFSNLDFHLPAVLNLHDLQHLHFPQNFHPADIDARNELYGLSANLADAVIVSSNFVREDLVSKLGIASEKVFVVPVTWDPTIENGLESFSVDQARQKYGLPSTYALYPAQFWQHKNHVRLVEALAIVHSKLGQRNLKLVLTGYRGHSGWPKVREAIIKYSLDDHVICLDHVPADHLAALYMAATFCVMPSTFEASSYPVIEAQMLGVPVMCSNVTSLPELMHGDAGLLFDPFDSDDIAEKMLRWLDDPEDRQAHARRAAVKARREHGLVNYVEGIERVYQYVTDSARGCQNEH